VPPTKSCLDVGPPSSEGTEAICRVPSGYFSQTPWYTLPDHLCRFRVRSIRWGYFLEPLQSLTNPIRSDNTRDPSHTTRPTNINVVPIDYPLRARLRGRLTLLRLALSRNPWSFGGSASHTPYRYSCQHSHFRYLHDPLPDRFTGLRNAPLPHARKRAHPKLRCITLAPIHLRRRNPYLDQ
jgi:hypothetical protein